MGLAAEKNLHTRLHDLVEGPESTLYALASFLSLAGVLIASMSDEDALAFLLTSSGITIGGFRLVLDVLNKKIARLEALILHGHSAGMGSGVATVPTPDQQIAVSLRDELLLEIADVRNQALRDDAQILEEVLEGDAENRNASLKDVAELRNELLKLKAEIADDPPEEGTSGGANGV